MGRTVKKLYKCDLCSKTFTNKNILGQHVLIHTGEKLYKCELCAKAFTQKNTLNIHKLFHTGEKIHKCEFCSKAFVLKCTLDVHKRIHTGEKPYRCDLCSQAFAQKGDLNNHKRIHTGEKPYKCELCSKAFAQKTDLIKHKRIHTGEKPYKCELCSKAFTTKPNLCRHKRTHTGKKPNSISCSKKGGLTLHNQIHTGGIPYKCKTCFKAFTQKNHLSRHESIHTGNQPYKCELCSKTFSEKGDLKKHKLIHTGEKLYKCELCSKAFNHKGNLDIHKRIHTGEKPYKCELCSKAFNQKPNLCRHKRTHTGKKPNSISCSKKGGLTLHNQIHTGGIPYKCKTCFKAFTQKNHLSRHESIHTGEKPYKCELCSKAFNQKAHLSKHIRIHTGEKSYKCEHCSKAFTYKRTLSKHKRIHTCENPYKCDFCSKAFTSKGDLNKHRRIHTGENPYKCELCSKAFTSKSKLIKHIRKHTHEEPNSISYSSPAKKEIFKNLPLSEGATSSIQKVESRIAKKNEDISRIEGFQSETQCSRRKKYEKIRVISSQLSSFRTQHMLTPEEVFDEMKLWQVEDGAITNKSMHPVKTEDYTMFLKICSLALKDSEAEIPPNILDSHMWIIIQCFLSNIEKTSSLTTSWNSFLRNQTFEDGNQPDDVDSRITGNVDCGIKEGDEQNDITNDDPFLNVDDLLITNVRSLSNSSPDSPSSCMVEESKEEGAAKNDLVIKIVSNNHLDYKDLFHIQRLAIKRRFETRETETRKVSIDSSFVSHGEIQIVCKNIETVEWCKEMIPQLPARDPTDSYRVYGSGEEPLTFLFHVPDIETEFDPHIFMFTLRLANEDLPDEEIKVLGIGDSDGREEVDGILVQLRFHKNHLCYLQESDFYLRYGFGTIQLRGPEVDRHRRIKAKQSS